MKEQLITYLLNKHIKTVQDLWAESKNYFLDKGMEMGGGYASWGDYISVRLENERFKVYLREV